VLRNGMIGLQWCCQHEADLILLQDIRRPVTLARFWAAICNEFHSERGTIEVRRLLRVADVKLNMIRSIERQEVDVLLCLWFSLEYLHGFTFQSKDHGCVRSSVGVFTKKIVKPCPKCKVSRLMAEVQFLTIETQLVTLLA